MLALIWIGIILAELEMLSGWTLFWYIFSLLIACVAEGLEGKVYEVEYKRNQKRW